MFIKAIDRDEYINTNMIRMLFVDLWEDGYAVFARMGRHRNHDLVISEHETIEEAHDHLEALVEEVNAH